MPGGLTLEYALRHKTRKPHAIPLALLAPLLPPRALPKRPVFVIGCPRSGNTVLYQLLRRTPGVATLGREGHVFWDTFHHPRTVGWESNALAPEDIRRFERRYLAWAIRLLAGRGRFLDKTPKNVLRLPYLDALFPDAHYVFVHRDGRAVVSSLVVGWRNRSTRGYALPQDFTVPGLPPRQWHYILIPGWRELNGRPVEEITARQYLACADAMLSFAPTLPADRRTEVRYEDLVADPGAELERILRETGLPVDGAAARARAIVRREDPAKWRSRTPDEVERVLPLLAPMLERMSYST